MADQIYIGEFAKGLTLNPLPFNIDNDAFPTLHNFYSWRKRAKRKRGTIFLGQLQKQIQSAASPNNWQEGAIGVLDGSGNFSGNLISIFSFESTTTFTAGSFSLSDGTNTYTEPATPDGTLVGAPSGSGTINYATGAITITGGAAGGTLTGNFSYFPGLPVMGLRNFVSSSATSQYPLLLSFDDSYSYQINDSGSSTFFFNVNYYKNSQNPFTWQGTDYQLFWTTNYSNCLWATNNNPGFQFESIDTIVVGNPTTINTAAPHRLVDGDYVWFNEITGADANLLNGQTAVITKTSSTQFTVPIDTTGKVINNSGIFQTLTATSPTASGDGIRWYDGNPTTNGYPTSTGKGWVNFAPPLTATSVSINNITSGLYYLVGALAIMNFKDRLIFFSPWIQTSSGAAIQLQDTAIWSWNGTPFYTTLVPSGETNDVSAFYVDQTGKGGYLAAGISQPIVTVTNNEDVLLVEFNQRKTRFIYTGNDLYPFLFFNINTELGCTSPFSGITLDRGGISIGAQGITLTTQQSAERIDLDIPDNVFQIQALNNGALRVNGIRDFYREWVYFSYPTNNSSWKFPTETFMWNYRDNTWAIFYENFTAQGTYRKSTHYTWATLPFKTWSQWREPWNAGSTSALFPSIVGGTPQGYVLIKGQGTGEGVSGTIAAFTNDGGNTKITSVNHCVKVNDYLNIVGISDTLTSTITNISKEKQAVITAANSFTNLRYVTITGVTGMTEINNQYVRIISANSESFVIDLDTSNFSNYTSGGTATLAIYNNQIGKVITVTDSDNFTIDLPFISFSYIGLGQFARLSQPLIQTKQFPFYWKEGRQVRLCAQKYLMDYTANGQVTVNISLSQDPDDVYNTNSNDSIVYSQLMYTCPESTNIGLTPANTNLQMPTAEGQYQIWHRFNTSLIGDTFQIGITLNDDQMRNLEFATNEITLHGMVFVVERGPHLA